MVAKVNKKDIAHSAFLRGHEAYIRYLVEKLPNHSEARKTLVNASRPYNQCDSKNQPGTRSPGTKMLSLIKARNGHGAA
ncbi:hypothetical protein KQ940_13275 [Marinobacterium sp. D7]|uniref:hypothetical protein n=1 Tax=Marinobacterium ramblicola TaxID=2849041 RepID=UPI001C2D180B|nr:hypothetical protein [Marinobacterium ramblicola]MBV1789023.1 hypothetical protein [Marinobacterium ramblicola]